MPVCRGFTNGATRLDNLSTIAKGQLLEKITVLGPAKMDEVCRALGATVACESI